MILVSVKRSILTVRRYIGYLATHERYFLGLDTLPLLLGITVYCYFWPGRYLRYDLKEPAEGLPEHEEMGTIDNRTIGVRDPEEGKHVA